jgi:hypothetical protein
MIVSLSRALLAGAVAASLATGCGPGRTAAATQSTPVAFDAAKSDPKAVALADEVIAACGGEAAWQKAKEVRFDVKIADGESVLLDATHIWDKWNGRHQFVYKPNSTTPDLKSPQTVTYEIYGDVQFADNDNTPAEAVAGMASQARQRLWTDSYALFMVFKLKDPGVILKLDGERADEAAPDKPAYDVLKVTFDPGVMGSPGDRYWIVIKKADHMPAWVELSPQGKPDDARIAYRFEEWQESGGLKFSTKRVNLGRASEVVTFSKIELRSEPEDELFIKQVK